MLEPSIYCRFLALKAFTRAEAAVRPKSLGRDLYPTNPFPGWPANVCLYRHGKHLVLSEGSWVPAWVWNSHPRQLPDSWLLSLLQSHSPTALVKAFRIIFSCHFWLLNHGITKCLPVAVRSLWRCVRVSLCAGWMLWSRSPALAFLCWQSTSAPTKMANGETVFFTALSPAQWLTAINLRLTCLKTSLLGSALDGVELCVVRHMGDNPFPPIFRSSLHPHLQSSTCTTRPERRLSPTEPSHRDQRQRPSPLWRGRKPQRSRDPLDAALGAADCAHLQQPCFLWVQQERRAAAKAPPRPVGAGARFRPRSPWGACQQQKIVEVLKSFS